MTEATLRRLWIAAILGLVALIVYWSLAPDPPVPEAMFSDKVGHYLAYLALALLGSGITPAGRVWRTMLRCLALGIALEILQAALTDDRVAEWGDLMANLAGILTAWIIAGHGGAGWGLRAAGWLARRRSS